MTVLADLRPAGLDLLIRPGSTTTLVLGWPAGTLAGRTFTSTLDDAALAVVVAGDEMTVTADDLITGALAVGVPAAWLLLEDIDGTDEPVMVGTWTPSDSPAAIDAATLTVTAGAAAVTVTSIGGVSEAQVSSIVDGLTIDAATLDTQTADDLLDRANHTSTQLAATISDLTVAAAVPLRHDWDVDGWAPFTSYIASPHGAATVALSVTTPRRGRATGHAATADGSRRDVHVRDDTLSTNSRVRATWWGGNVYDAAVATPQMGICQRWVDLGGGEWIAVVITNNIFLTDPNQVNVNLWHSNGTTLTLGDAGGTKDFNGVLSRAVAVTSRLRFDFGGYINSLTAVPSHLYGLAVGDAITVNSSDSTFNTTAQACTGANKLSGSVSYTESTTLSPVPLTIDTGTITPPVHKKFWPMEMESVLVGDILRLKVWRYQDEEPDWGTAANVLEYDISAATNLTAPTGPGLSGVVSAHLQSSAYCEWGRFECTALP